MTMVSKAPIMDVTAFVTLVPTFYFRYRLAMQFGSIRPIIMTTMVRTIHP